MLVGIPASLSMKLCLMPALGAISLLTASHVHAGVAYAKAGVRVIGQPRVEQERTAPDRVIATASDQDAFGHGAGSIAYSLGTKLEADLHARAYSAGFSESYAEMSSTASDIVVRRRDGSGSGATVSVTALVTPDMLTTFTGTPGPWDLAFNYGTIRWSASVVDGNGVTQSVGGYSVESLESGLSGDAIGATYALTFEVQVGVAFTMSLAMSAFAESSGSFPYAGDQMLTLSTASLKLGTPVPSLVGGGQSMAFVLPEGYTADSAEFGIVDNLIQVPAPGAVSLLGAAGLVAGRRRTRR